MTETFNIAGYTRISVDDELDRDNVSIENQKAIIEDFVKTQFPGSSLTFFEDRDRSGYTFEQREGYQKMREGFYYFIQFEADATCPAEVERHVRIMDNVMRYLVVKKEA